MDETERKFDALAKWLGNLEERVDRDSSQMVAGIDKRLAILENVVERLGKDLHQISQNLGRLVWAVGLTLLAGVVQFLLKGGFGA
jgi:hypothetical protein